MTGRASITWPQALAWRMERHLLDPLGRLPVEGVVRRLCGVQAQVASSAELAVRVRQATSEAGEVGQALADGRLIKTWAMRGTLHLLAAEDAGAFLSLMAAGRSWERPSWQRYFGMTPRHWELFGPAVREALDDAVLTREELIAAVTASPGLSHVGGQLASGWGTLLKPLAWQGDLCFGPNRGPRVTFTRPARASTRWTGVLDPDEAAPLVITAYLRAYGPATAQHLISWLARGWLGQRKVKAWFAAMGDRQTEIDLEGAPAYVLADDLDGLVATRPTSAVRLLPGFDQWVLGPGTDDGHVTAPARRSAVSLQSGWIAPVVVAGGMVAGTWALDGGRAIIHWFTEAGQPPGAALEAEVARIGELGGRPLEALISPA